MRDTDTDRPSVSVLVPSGGVVCVEQLVVKWARIVRLLLRAPFTQNGWRQGIFQVWILWLQRQVLVCVV